MLRAEGGSHKSPNTNERDGAFDPLAESERVAEMLRGCGVAAAAQDALDDATGEPATVLLRAGDIVHPSTAALDLEDLQVQPNATAYDLEGIRMSPEDEAMALVEQTARDPGGGGGIPTSANAARLEVFNRVLGGGGGGGGSAGPQEPPPGTLIKFGSTSIPPAEPEELLAAASRPDTVFALCGNRQGKSTADTVGRIQGLFEDPESPPNLMLDPTLFQRYDVEVTPTMVLFRDAGLPPLRATGTVDVARLQPAVGTEQVGFDLPDAPVDSAFLESVPHAATAVPYRLGPAESVRVSPGAGSVAAQAATSPEVPPSTRSNRVPPGRCSLNRRSPSCARFLAAFTSRSCSAPHLSHRQRRSARLRPSRIVWHALDRGAHPSNVAHVPGSARTPGPTARHRRDGRALRYATRPGLRVGFVREASEVDVTAHLIGDVTDAEGQVIARAGGSFNPLHTLPMSSTFVAFRATSRAHVDVVARVTPQTSAAGGRTVLMATGAGEGREGVMQRLEQELGTHVYALEPHIARRFKLRHLPAAVIAAADRLLEREWAVESDSDTNDLLETVEEVQDVQEVVEQLERVFRILRCAGHRLTAFVTSRCPSRDAGSPLGVERALTRRQAW